MDIDKEDRRHTRACDNGCSSTSFMGDLASLLADTGDDSKSAIVVDGLITPSLDLNTYTSHHLVGGYGEQFTL
jgi:hypothetical protein